MQDTYNQNIRNYSHGHIILQNDVYIPSRRNNRLQVDDLMYMSVLAFEYFKWYDAAIRYLKEAINLSKSVANTQLNPIPNKLYISMLQKKKEYVSFHNELIDKKPIHLGPDWKAHVVKVNPGNCNYVSDRFLQYK